MVLFLVILMVFLTHKGPTTQLIKATSVIMGKVDMLAERELS